MGDMLKFMETKNIHISRSSAILHERCPRCYQGQLFLHKPYSLKFMEMNKNCPVCRQDLEVEPGFYYGAMYISYALTLTVVIPTIIAVYFLMNDPAVWVYLSIISGLLLGLTPLSFRYARILMLYWFGFIKPEPQRHSRLEVKV
jgi:uncharacterized protein (DUF983 family)